MKALLVIDVQNDFCPGGSLPAPGGDEVVPVINRLMARFPLVIASKDWHPEVTRHFATWPRHCVQGTAGAEFHPGLEAGRIGQIVLKGAGEMDEGYSVFTGIDIDLEAFLRARGVDELYVTGLVTEYCVKETAIDAQQRGFTTFVIPEAIKAVELHPGDGERALQAMAAAGVTILPAATVMGR